MGTRCADHVTPLYPKKLALTSPTGGGRSVGIVRSRTKATEFSLVLLASLGAKSFKRSDNSKAPTKTINKTLYYHYYYYYHHYYYYILSVLHYSK